MSQLDYIGHKRHQSHAGGGLLLWKTYTLEHPDRQKYAQKRQDERCVKRGRDMEQDCGFGVLMAACYGF